MGHILTQVGAGGRFIFSVIAGLLATYSLFFLMTILIEFGRTEIDQPDFVKIGDVVQPPEEIKTTTEIEVPEREDTPPPPELDIAPPEIPPDAVAVRAPSQTFSSKFDYGGIKVTAGGGQRQPIFRVNPQYPPRAAARGVEGWVLMKFDIDEEGRVREATVVDNEPSAIFNSAALSAVRKWRYTPEVQDGRAVYVSGEQVRLVFKLSQ